MQEVANNQKFSITNIVNSKEYQTQCRGAFDKEVAQKFVADIGSVISANPSLQKCNLSSILSSGMVAQQLKLPLTPSLGFAYIVPYGTNAQFQIGWRGLVQLAIRTNQYQSIGCDVIREGEYLGRDKLTGEPIFEFHDDVSKEVIGYYAYFRLNSGFTKVVYWSKEKAEQHANTYSKAHQGSSRGGEYDNWTKMFDQMALKTVLKQVLKWGIMSPDIQKAVELDQAVVKNDKPVYIDNPNSKSKAVEIDEDTGEVKPEDKELSDLLK